MLVLEVGYHFYSFSHSQGISISCLGATNSSYATDCIYPTIVQVYKTKFSLSYSSHFLFSSFSFFFLHLSTFPSLYSLFPLFSTLSFHFSISYFLFIFTPLFLLLFAVSPVCRLYFVFSPTLICVSFSGCF